MALMSLGTIFRLLGVRSDVSIMISRISKIGVLCGSVCRRRSSTEEKLAIVQEIYEP